MIKSNELIEFENLCNKIRKKFNRGYGIVPGDARPLSVHIRIMNEALETGVFPDPLGEGVLSP